MKGGSFLLYLLVVSTLAVTLRVWWGVRGLREMAISEELKPLRQELREMRSELEEVNRVTLKQQATLYKIEAMLDLQGERKAERTPSALGETIAENSSETGGHDVPPPPPPSIDDRALEAFVRTQAGRSAASLSVEERAPASPAATETAAPAARTSSGRQTVVFTHGASGGNSSERRAAGERAAVSTGPAMPDALTLEDLAALVSTVSWQHAHESVSTTLGEARTARIGTQASVYATVDQADPNLPGASPVSAEPRIGVAEAVQAGRTLSSVVQSSVTSEQRRLEVIEGASTPRRVTTVPALTAAERPEVPPIRASRVVRERRAHELDLAPSLLLSEQFVPSRERQAKVTISDILEAEEKE